MILACRNREKGEKLKAEFECDAAKLGLLKASVEVAVLDVSDLKAVKEFATRWRQAQRPLHVLINNAGILQLGGLNTLSFQLDSVMPCSTSEG